MRGQASDARYFMRRAREEARLAMMTDEPSVAAAHRGLSVQYAAHAKRALEAGGSPEPSAFPQFEPLQTDHVMTPDIEARIRPA